MNLLFSALARYVRFSERGRHKAPSGRRSSFRPRLDMLENRAPPFHLRGDHHPMHWLRLQGDVTELYDAAVLPGVARPMALGFKTDESQRVLAVEDEGTL